MDRQQIVIKNEQILKYQEKNKIRTIFNNLVKQILLKKPDDPISYLIQYLNKTNKCKLIICIIGYHNQQRTKLSTIISNKFNYQHINLSVLFKEQDYHIIHDDVINQQVIKNIKAVPDIYKGIVISGYPCNTIQLDYLQKSGIVLPDRYFVMQCSQKHQMEYYSKYKYDEEEILSILSRNRMELKQLQEILGQLIDYVPENIQQSTDKIAKTLNVKAGKKILPFESPRIIAVHPPFLPAKSIPALKEIFCLNYISIQNTIDKLNNKIKFKNYVDTYIRKNQSISKQIQLALVENQSKSATSKNKGFIIDGWPRQKLSLPLLQQYFLRPHLILAFRQTRQKILEMFNSLDGSSLSLFPISCKPTVQKYLQQLTVYNEMIQELKNYKNVQILSLNQSSTEIIKIVENLLNNSDIYN